MLLIVGEFFLLLALESSHALEHLIPVNEGSVKLVDADELCLTANGQSACTAHSRSVHHNRVQGNLAGNIVLLSGKV